MQIDRSIEWAKENALGHDCTGFLAACDLNALWVSHNESSDGILGDDFVRLQIYLRAVQRDRTDSRLYHVRGRSRTRRKNICDFVGTIQLQRAGEFANQTSGEPRHGVLTANYQLIEDKRQTGAGIYRGVVATLWREAARGMIALDDREEGADGYKNNTFVGTWTSDHSGKTKRCLWGDYRLPYVAGFDTGDGEIVIAPRYRKDGWETYATDADRNDRWWHR